MSEPLLRLFAFALLLALLGCSLDSRVEFGDSIVSAIASGSGEYDEWLSPAAIGELESARRELQGQPTRVLIDESWGVIELGYCFPSGAFVYLTVPSSSDDNRLLSFGVHRAGLAAAARCVDSDAAA